VKSEECPTSLRFEDTTDIFDILHLRHFVPAEDSEEGKK
jgi:hypothetical protein